MSKKNKEFLKIALETSGGLLQLAFAWVPKIGVYSNGY